MNVALFPDPGSVETDVFAFHHVGIETGCPIEDPFRRVRVRATLTRPGGGAREIEGFCDSQDGSVYAVRFMPTEPGEHSYAIRLSFDGREWDFSGAFTAMGAGRKGLLEADGWGFRWGGTGEPFFWNSTTAYMMAGLEEVATLAALERLAALGINRIRVSLCPSRQTDGGRWFEPQVTPRTDFTYSYGPWLCARPDSQRDPGPDVTRFDVAYWRRFERLLQWAEERGIVVQTIFFTDAQEPQNYPFERPAPKSGGAADFDDSTRKPDESEKRYFAYASARLSAHSNVEWCVTNEWALFQSNAWVDEMGAFLTSKDPYGHLCSVHGHGHFPFRASLWCTHALFQSWDEHGSYDFTLENRAEQERTGRVIPQVNEEFGYEDHYPGPWGGGRTAPARDAQSRVRLAWEIVMAGGHATTGESATSGAGGWINGIGDKVGLLEGHRRLREFFEAIPGWETLQPAGRFVLESATHRVTYDVPSGAATCEAIGSLTGHRG